MKPRSWHDASFSVKYRCPVFQTRQFDSSPSTQISPIRSSSTSRIRIVRSVTLKMRRTGGLGSASAAGSSSNGRSKRSLIREIDELVEAVTQTLDVDRSSGLLIGFDDDGVQAR